MTILRILVKQASRFANLAARSESTKNGLSSSVNNTSNNNNNSSNRNAELRRNISEDNFVETKPYSKSLSGLNPATMSPVCAAGMYNGFSGFIEASPPDSAIWPRFDGSASPHRVAYTPPRPLPPAEARQKETARDNYEISLGEKFGGSARPRASSQPASAIVSSTGYGGG